MKNSILLAAGIAAMLFLGYVTAGGSAQDLVWLLVPGLALVIGILALTKFLK